VIARELQQDEIVVVQETEYTGAGKHPTAQLTLARELGIEVRTGPRSEDAPGQRIVIPESVGEMGITEVDLHAMRRSYLRRIATRSGGRALEEHEVRYLADDLNVEPATIEGEWERMAGAAAAVQARGAARG
jgi:hypothetical protein